ncbi:unnamed protein product [Rotaria sp. Silwood1]|nr:unnamed protein product [Rotaria sp. Silwood1]
MKKVTSRWVPHELTDEQKQQGVQFCRENLAKFQTGSWRLCDIITGDETRSADKKRITLLHDNARPHIHSDVINYLTEEDINIMPHPPYSPDLAPCDYWLNDCIKHNLTDQLNEKSSARAVSKVVKNIPEEEYKKNF